MWGVGSDGVVSQTPTSIGNGINELHNGNDSDSLGEPVITVTSATPTDVPELVRRAKVAFDADEVDPEEAERILKELR